MSFTLRRVVVVVLAVTHQMAAQLSEDFDTVVPPELPPGWTSTNARAASDFVTAASLAASAPNCVLASNATVEQALTSPVLQLQGLLVHALTFQTRRSLTFRAGICLEASTDGGVSFTMSIGDTIRVGQSAGSYERHRLAVPPALGEHPRLRWRVIPDNAGASGTLRIDDIALEADRFYDLAARSLAFLPALPGEPLLASVEIANTGLLPLPSCDVVVALDLDGDSFFAPHERVVLGAQVPVPGESLELRCEAGPSPSHTTRAMAAVHSALDPWAANDTVYAIITPGVPRGEVVFNEIMYAPLTGGAEYIEIALRTPRNDGLGGWKLTWAGLEAGSGNSLVFPDSPASGGAFVLVASRALEAELKPNEKGIDVLVRSNLVLRNDGGLLVLKDPSGLTADSLQYGPWWHTPSVVETRGRSLEKLLPDLPSADGRNWATCLEPAGGTPGRPNSVSVSSVRTEARLACSPNPFSPDGDGVDDWTLIRYAFPTKVHAVDLTIHDGRGRMVRHLATRELGGLSGTLVWDGRDDATETVRLGIYVVLIRGTDSQGGDLLAAKAAVVVGRALR